MQKWEYLFVSKMSSGQEQGTVYKMNGEHITYREGEDELWLVVNDLGQKGWELIKIEGNVDLIFKRPVE
jgi:hypothetical protein